MVQAGQRRDAKQRIRAAAHKARHHREGLRRLQRTRHQRGLQPHAGAGILEGASDPGEQLRFLLCPAPPFSETDRRGSHPLIPVLHHSGKGVPLQDPAALQGPQGVQATEGIRSAPGQLLKEGHGRRITAFNEEALRRESPPARRMTQMADKLGRGRLVETRAPAIDRAVNPYHPVDTSEILASFEVAIANLVADPGHHEDHVLNDPARKIRQVEGPVGTDARVDRPEAFIRGGEELLLRRIVAGGFRAQAGLQLQAADEVPTGLRDKDVAARLRSVLVPVVVAGAGRDGIRAKPAVLAQLHRTERDSRGHPDRIHQLRLCRDIGVDA